MASNDPTPSSVHALRQRHRDTNTTADRQAEQEMRIAAVAFDVQDAIVVMDSQRRILRVNQAFTDITGYSKADVLGKPSSILRSRQQPGASYDDIWYAVSDKGWDRADRWLQNKGGNDFFARGTTTAVKDPQGQTTHYVITFFDETLKLQQDAQRVQHEAAQREALVREVHHRVKNNLQGIGGLLRQFATDKPEIAEQLQLVAGHLNGISVVHGLLGRNDRSLVRLCELTREIALATSLLWQTEITLDIPDGWLFRVVAEKEAVSMALVLHELMVNAIKHGGKARGHVSITLRQGPGAEGVELRILNSGYLRTNEDRPTDHHHGLQLVESLRPREGFSVTLMQCADQVQTLILVTSPVLTLDTNS